MNASPGKRMVAWCLYDWGSSAYATLVMTFVYATYFVKNLAPDPTLGTVYWSRAMAASGVLVGVLAPLLGGVADAFSARRFFLTAASLACCVATALLTIPAPNGEAAVTTALLLFVVANTSFELASVFANAYLPVLATPKSAGRLSGYAWGTGYLGGLSCLALAFLVIQSPHLPILSSLEYDLRVRLTNLLAASWYLLFALPFLLVAPREEEIPRPARRLFRQIPRTITRLKAYPGILRYLVAHLLYNDGLVTIFAFGGIYAAGTFGMSLNEVMIFAVALNLVAGLGAMLLGHLDDRLGSRRTILMSLASLGIATLVITLVSDRLWFWIFGLVIGFFIGPVQSASRTLMGRITPLEHRAELFGFYTLSGRLTSFLGPLLFGLATDIGGSQRFGVATILPFFVIGGWLLHKLEITEPHLPPGKGGTGLP